MNRDELAARLLEALLSNPNCEPEDVKHNAIVAVRNADALIQQLGSRNGQQFQVASPELQRKILQDMWNGDPPP